MAELKEGKFIFRYGDAKGIAEVTHEVGTKKVIRFTLKTGSVLKKKPEASYKESENGFYILQEDVEFTSSSGAAGLVSGASICGPESWFTEDGLSMREYFEIPLKHRSPYKSKTSKEFEISPEERNEYEEPLEDIYPILERVDITSQNDKVEYVYAYYYPSRKELADLKKETRWAIKIGKASGDAPSRIRQQMGTSNDEEPIIALIITCDNSTVLESALHSCFKVADKHIEAPTIGTEWYRTNPDEIKNFVEMMKKSKSEK